MGLDYMRLARTARLSNKFLNGIKGLANLANLANQKQGKPLWAYPYPHPSLSNNFIKNRLSRLSRLANILITLIYLLDNLRQPHPTLALEATQ